jgi:hypothetical protein
MEMRHPGYLGVYPGINELEMSWALFRAGFQHFFLVNPYGVEEAWYSLVYRFLTLPTDEDMQCYFKEGRGALVVPSDTTPGVSHWLTFEDGRVYDPKEQPEFPDPESGLGRWLKTDWVKLYASWKQGTSGCALITAGRLKRAVAGQSQKSRV